MKINDIYDAFKNLFPNFEDHVINYEKVGSRMIKLYFDDQQIKYFLYTNSFDWNFGTKPYRRRPNPGYTDNKQKENKEVK